MSAKSEDWKMPSKVDPTKFVKTIDMRPVISQMGLSIKNQGARGTCSVFATTFLLEYMVCKERGLRIQTWPQDSKNRSINFSEEYLNAVANMATGRGDDGDFFESCWLGYRDFGIVGEEWFPYQQTFDDRRPDNELIEVGKAARFFKADLMYSQKKPTQPNFSPKGLSDQQLSAVINQLDNQVPVAFGKHIARDIQTVSSGGLNILNDIADETDQPGAHSVAIVGYSASRVIPSNGYFIFRNSYGEGWGDKGYGYLSFNYARKYVYDAVVYDRASGFLPGVTKPVKPFEIRLPPPSLIEMDKIGKLIHPNSRMR